MKKKLLVIGILTVLVGAERVYAYYQNCPNAYENHYAERPTDNMNTPCQNRTENCYQDCQQGNCNGDHAHYGKHHGHNNGGAHRQNCTYRNNR